MDSILENAVHFLDMHRQPAGQGLTSAESSCWAAAATGTETGLETVASTVATETGRHLLDLVRFTLRACHILFLLRGKHQGFKDGLAFFADEFINRHVVCYSL
jgi:hypothetical protein